MGEERVGAGALPSGTVAFLLTDVAGSTGMWQAEPDAMARAISRHYEILDDVIVAHGGSRPIEQGEGDSVVGAFSRSSSAVLAALDAQRRLQSERWPTSEPLKVRMAVHTGEALQRDGFDYVGPGIIRTARLRALAHGGQVLVSGPARELAVDDLPDDVELLDLGVHRLKDLDRAEHVWQLAHPDIDAAFSPLRSLDSVPNNLPVALSSFVGRFDEIDTVARLILDNRLVTLVGPGGAGKTRLAQQVAAETVEAFADGVWWIDLVTLDDHELVASAVSRALQLPEDRNDRIAGVARRLAAKRALVVLDNCEHLLDGCAALAGEVLTSCGGITFLTTSRAPLNLPGEVSWRLPPFSQDDAVRLFAERAASVQRDFGLAGGGADDVAAICERLDGIPLAIELAAARSRVLTPREILEGLADSMRLLSSSARGTLAHHQTMDASIRWSHSLLRDEERILFRRLAIFESPFTIEAATAAVSDEVLPAASVLDALEQLVDQSLVQRDDQRGTARFRMLETVRQFARAALDEAGETDVLAARHAAHFAERARSLWPLFEPSMTDLLDQSDEEFDDLAAMLRFLEVNATPEEHAEVAMACLPAMGVRHVAEAAALGASVAARVEPMSVLGGHLQLQLALVDPSSTEYVGLGLAAATETADPELLAHASFWSGWGVAAADPTPANVAALAETQERLASIGESHFSRGYWTFLGLERAMGRHEAATRAAELAKTETICKRCSVMVWSESALLALALGDLVAADQAAERALAFGTEVRDAGFLAHVRLTEAEVAAYAGRPCDLPTIEDELASAKASGNDMAIGYLSEARAVSLLADTGLLDDADLVTAIDALDGQWPKRVEARLRRAALRHVAGDLEGATQIVDELRALAAEWEAGPWLVAQLDLRSGALALDAGDPAAAEELAHSALQTAMSGPWPPLAVAALELLATIAAIRESHVEAARLAGAADAQRDDLGLRLDLDPERRRRELALGDAKAALGDGPFGAAWDEGHRLTLAEAVSYARRARGERKRPSHGWDGLTPTERQVADLAVGGMSNAEIAERLFIGRETVKTHLSNVYAKVGVANRTQLVADAAKRGIT